jgi:hypothetical protein
MLGYATASGVLRLGRGAFFPSEKSDLPLRRSTVISEDDLIPQFGYVGAVYPSTRILFLGINPGKGPDDVRLPEDEQMMPPLASFKESPTERNYATARDAYKEVCQSFKFWRRHCAKVLEGGNLAAREIAFSNCLPWRTESGANFSGYVELKAAEHHLRPLIRELDPSLIVAIGKTKVPSILEMTGLKLPQIIPWNCALALTESVKQERLNAINDLRDFVKKTLNR